MTYFPPQSGPCVICGDTNYGLSCGGPTICPKCDCGTFDAATVEKQSRVIAELRKEVAILRDVLMNPDPDSEPDVQRLHREKCDALDEVYKLQGALAPFAKLAEFISESHRDTRPIIYGLDPVLAGRLTIGDLRRAALALTRPDRASPAQKETP